jgi:hypothetical protein
VIFDPPLKPHVVFYHHAPRFPIPCTVTPDRSLPVSRTTSVEPRAPGPPWTFATRTPANTLAVSRDMCRRDPEAVAATTARGDECVTHHNARSLGLRWASAGGGDPVMSPAAVRCRSKVTKVPRIAPWFSATSVAPGPRPRLDVTLDLSAAAAAPVSSPDLGCSSRSLPGPRLQPVWTSAATTAPVAPWTSATATAPIAAVFSYGCGSDRSLDLSALRPARLRSAPGHSAAAAAPDRSLVQQQRLRLRCPLDLGTAAAPMLPGPRQRLAPSLPGLASATPALMDLGCGYGSDRSLDASAGYGSDRSLWTSYGFGSDPPGWLQVKNGVKRSLWRFQTRVSA